MAAIQQAAKLSRAVLAVEDKGVIEKEDLSPVTVADFAIQALIVATLSRAFPTDRFVGEESAAALRENPTLLRRTWDYLERVAHEAGVDTPACIPESPERMCEMIDQCGGVPGRGDDDRVWIIDPIDGTKTFVRGEMFGINVALLKGGKQVAGIVGLPLMAVDPPSPVTNSTIDLSGKGSIMFAVRGYGTYIRPLTGSLTETKPRRVQALPRDKALEDMRVASCFNLVDSGIDSAHADVAAKLGVEFPGCDLVGWVPRWAVLGLGLAEVTVWVYKERERRGKIWDHAGAMLLFEEVGGKITDVDGKEIDLAAGRKMVANFGFVAAPEHLHAKVLETVRQVLVDSGKGHLLEKA